MNIFHSILIEQSIGVSSFFEFFYFAMLTVGPRSDVDTHGVPEEVTRIQSEQQRKYQLRPSGRNTDSFRDTMDELANSEAPLSGFDPEDRPKSNSGRMRKSSSFSSSKHKHDKSTDVDATTAVDHSLRRMQKGNNASGDNSDDAFEFHAANSGLNVHRRTQGSEESTNNFNSALGRLLETSHKQYFGSSSSELYEVLSLSQNSPLDKSPYVKPEKKLIDYPNQAMNAPLHNRMVPLDEKRVDANKNRRKRLEQHGNIATMIFPWLYLSGAGPARDTHTINRYKIDLIINCAGEAVSNAFEPGSIHRTPHSEENGESPFSEDEECMSAEGTSRDRISGTTIASNSCLSQFTDGYSERPDYATEMEGHAFADSYSGSRDYTRTSTYRDSFTPYSEKLSEESTRPPFSHTTLPLSQSFDAAYHQSRFARERYGSYAYSKQLASSFPGPNSYQDDLFPVECKKLKPGRVVSYLTLRLCDGPSENIGCLFPFVVSVIEKARKSGKIVLIHCHQGVSRSAAFVIAYTMWAARISQVFAHEYVLGRRAIVSPNVGFLCQLIEWEEFLSATVGCLDRPVGGVTEGFYEGEVTISSDKEIPAEDLSDVVLQDASEMQESLHLPHETLMTFEFHCHAKGCYTIGPFFNTEDYETNSYKRVKLPPSLSLVRCRKYRRQERPSLALLRDVFPKPIVFVTEWHRVKAKALYNAETLENYQSSVSPSTSKESDSAESIIIPRIFVSASANESGLVYLDYRNSMPKNEFVEHLHRELNFITEISSRYSTMNQCHILRYLIRNGLLGSHHTKSKKCRSHSMDCDNLVGEDKDPVSLDDDDSDLEVDPVLPDVTAGINWENWAVLDDIDEPLRWAGERIPENAQREILSTIARRSTKSYKLLPVCATPILWKNPIINWREPCYCDNTLILDALSKIPKSDSRDIIPACNSRCYCKKDEERTQKCRNPVYTANFFGYSSPNSTANDASSGVSDSNLIDSLPWQFLSSLSTSIATNSPFSLDSEPMATKMEAPLGMDRGRSNLLHLLMQRGDELRLDREREADK